MQKYLAKAEIVLLASNGLEEDAISNGIKFGAKVVQHKTNEDKYIMTIAQGAVDGKKEVEL